MMKPLLVLCALGSTLLFSKDLPPDSGPPKAFHLAQADDYTLSNGMRVTVVPYGSVPLTAVRAFIEAGGVNETASQVWLSRLTAEMMKEGTAEQSGEQIARTAADCGGQLEIDTTTEATSIGGVVLSDTSARFLALVADIVRHPAFPASELPRVKASFGRELAVAKTQSQEIARDHFLKTMFPNSPYGRLFPAEDDLKGYTLEQVQRFYKDNYGARRTHLYVAGKIDGDLRAAIEKAFGDWERGAEPAHFDVAPVKAHSVALIDRPGAAQSTVMIGLPIAPATDPDTIPLRVMDALLGGSFASRITSNIREQKGYTYSPHSQVAAEPGFAYWVEQADVTSAVTGPSIKEIMSEIDKLRQASPSNAELSGIQSYLAGMFVIRNTLSADAVIGQLRFVDSRGLPRSYLTDYVPKVSAVKPQDIQGMAEKYLDPQKMTVVVVGDRSVVADQLKPFEQVAP